MSIKIHHPGDYSGLHNLMMDTALSTADTSADDWKDRLEELFHVFTLINEDAYIFLSDMAHDYSIWSRNVVDRFGLSGTHLYQASVEWEEHIHPDDREDYHKSIERIFSGEMDSHDMQYRSMDANGNYNICTCREFVMRDEDGNPKYFGGSIKNHTLENRIDPLTGLMNRAGFFEALKNHIDNHQEAKILMFGPSEFSEVNSLYGYKFGNKVIQEGARYFSSVLANLGDYFRLDGTKSILISHNTSLDVLKEKYEIIRNHIFHELEVDGIKLPLRMNGAILELDQFNIDDNTVFGCLNTAYQISKRQRQGGLVVFNEEGRDHSRDGLRKINAIRLSQTEGYHGFELFYQPIMDADSERITGAEALLRWKNDEFGYVPPDQFMPVLENDARFIGLGKWILEIAMTEGLAMVDRYPDFILHVNLAYPQIDDPGFVDDVVYLLKKTGYPARNLCLELTERCRLADTKILRQVIAQLKAYGVEFALDDFGTGYSSANALNVMDIDIIKIDKSFVHDIETNLKSKKLLRNFVNLAKIYDSRICVEGIETSAMRDISSVMDVDYLQGYYYSKPIPFADFCEKYDIDMEHLTNVPKAAI